MKLLDKHIGATVLGAVVVVLCIVAGLDTVFAFIAELGDIENDYQLYEAILYILMTVPRRVYEFISVATLIGSLIGLGVLANSNELTVMRAAGVSVSKIVYMACKPVILVVVFGLLSNSMNFTNIGS